MQYAAVVLALAGAAFAQLPGVPACADSVLQPALSSCASSPEGLIACLCSSAPSFSAPIVAACPCTDVNSALGAAKGFCTGLAFTPLNCDAKTTTTLASSPVATSTPATTTPVAVSETSSPASGSSSSSIASSTGSVSSKASSTYSSVSGAATSTSNGTVTTVPPSQTSVVVGAGSALQIGGAVMVGALLAAIAL